MLRERFRGSKVFFLFFCRNLKISPRGSTTSGDDTNGDFNSDCSKRLPPYLPFSDLNHGSHDFINSRKLELVDLQGEGKGFFPCKVVSSRVLIFVDSLQIKQVRKHKNKENKTNQLSSTQVRKTSVLRNFSSIFSISYFIRRS